MSTNNSSTTFGRHPDDNKAQVSGGREVARLPAKWRKESMDLELHPAGRAARRVLAIELEHALSAPQERPDADRVLKDALFACIAEGHTSRRYGGVAYQGGHASVVFSVEPTEQARPDAAARLVEAMKKLMRGYEARMGEWENPEFNDEYNEADEALDHFIAAQQEKDHE